MNLYSGECKLASLTKLRSKTLVLQLWGLQGQPGIRMFNDAYVMVWRQGGRFFWHGNYCQFFLYPVMWLKKYSPFVYESGVGIFVLL